MGNTMVFMTGPRNPKTLEDAIEIIIQSSKLFMEAFRNGNYNQCEKYSTDAFKSFDYVVNQCLRLRDDFTTCPDKTDDMEAFLKLLNNIKIGKIAYNITNQEKLDLNINAMSAALPIRKNHKKIALGKLMNKLKHRRDDLMGFRIETGKHKFLIYVDSFGKEANCIVEFDVLDFCNKCNFLVKLSGNN